ncbi:MAG: M24 family metallopeptidase [Bryobacteraceae bacterium]|nr:M24 family metallopeptidase [Bryobacteraceae bacterium]
MNLAEIQEKLLAEHLHGWLFFDHHQRDPLAYRVLGLPTGIVATRRWYYFIPASGEPRGLVHRIEPHSLDAVPGEKFPYAGWSAQLDGLRRVLGGARRVAMQYSPMCAIPYVSMVDAGTIELVRSLGVEIVSSANLIQYFEARWSEEQLAMHLEAGRRVDRIRAAAFRRIGEKHREGSPVTEYEIQQFIRSEFAAQGMITDHGPIVAVNANASDPHYEPSAERHSPIRPGDAVLIDLWAKLDRPDAVYYDVTWDGFCGAQPPSGLVNIFEIVRDARDAAVARVRRAIAAGQSLQGFEVDDAARGFIRERGFADFFFHRTGHSIGPDVHGTGANMDNLETHDERAVIAGTCFSVEPGIYLPEFGIRSEVNVYVEHSDARVTGEVQDALILV